MKFLDTIGLAYFWEKIKDWANSRFFSKEGGEISPKSGLQYTINGEHLGITTSGGENETINIFDVDENGMEAIAIVKTGGTATQVLMADGSVKTLNASNGIAGLDSNGYVPLSQLGNLDTTVAEVVTALPTTNIKKHIYLIKDTGGVTQNQYEEYIYTGDTSAAYDASKWEKLGDFRATVDLADYAKKSEAIHEVILGIQESTINLGINYVNGNQKEVILPAATVDHCGLMSPSDKTKLNLLDTLKVKTNVDVSRLLTASGTLPIFITYDTNFLQVFFNTVAGDAISFKLPAAGDRAGLMSVADKTKLDSIDTTYAKKIETVDLSNIRVDEKVISTTQQGQILNQVILFSNFHSDNDNTTIEIAFKDATSNMSGFMSIRDKNKLDTIASGATADSAITTAEIDALFA